MRVMALDIGEVRVGIALSDPLGKVATPLTVLPLEDVLVGGSTTKPQLASRFRRLLEDWLPQQLVVGLPLSLDGHEGAQAARIRTVTEAIVQVSALPVAWIDERLSSVAAKRSLREMGQDERTTRGKVDMIAASLFLQTWLDQNSEG